MEETTNQPNPLANSSPETTPSPSGQPDVEERIKGFQKALNMKHGELVRKEQEWLQQKSLLSQELESYKSRYVELSGKTAELERKALENEQRAATLAAQVERITKIAAHGLLDYEQKGLLRTDLQGEAFDKYLQEFASLLGESKKQGAQEILRGATPPPSGGRETPSSPQDVMKAMADALQRGDMETYNKLADQLYRPAKKE